MDHFHFRNGRLCAEDVPVEEIAVRVGTPVYVYSTATLERHYRVFRAAVDDPGALICYAVKANANMAVIRTLARLGAGADVVSGGELQCALAAGVAPERIVFSGVGKTRDEMAAALMAGVFQINVESEPELEALAEVAASLGRVAPVALRVNPDVDAGTHAKITTGRSENKFGIDWTAAPALLARAAAMPGLSLRGVAVHIGSQLSDLGPFRQAFQRVRDLVVDLRRAGHAMHTLDLGGGLGIPYGDEAAPVPSPGQYAEVVRHAVAGLDCRLILEPGRLLVGNAGVLVTRVLYVKAGATRTFVIVDAAMNDLLRPALYNARHTVVPVRESSAADAQATTVDLVGPICESGDCLAAGAALPPLASGDLLAVRTAGAYGAAMASTYNVRPLVAEVMVNGSDMAVIAERGTIESILNRQRLPVWLDDEASAPVPRRAVGE
ncbi:MAG: diaminopimelate decarboxylase [Rhodospirillales bacterium]|nr:diaminopimelate decarboxylase [Rhodospirillales bacterium]